MIKRELVEEMAQIINGSTELDTIAYYRCMKIAKTLYNAGYQKIPEDSIVLSREEICELKYQAKEDFNKAYDLGSKEMAEKIFSKLLKEFDKRKSCGNANVVVYEIAKQFGVKIKE